MEKVEIDKEYVINRIKSLEQTSIVQELIYLNNLLKENAEENKPEGNRPD